MEYSVYIEAVFPMKWRLFAQSGKKRRLAGGKYGKQGLNMQCLVLTSQTQIYFLHSKIGPLSLFFFIFPLPSCQRMNESLHASLNALNGIYL